MEIVCPTCNRQFREQDLDRDVDGLPDKLYALCISESFI